MLKSQLRKYGIIVVIRTDLANAKGLVVRVEIDSARIGRFELHHEKGA